MAILIKSKKGIKTITGGTTRGGIIRTMGNRPAIFSSKEKARMAIASAASKRFKSKDKRKKFINAFVLKKVK